MWLKAWGLKKGVLVLDDTSLPKKGKFSVGVARHDCGALGKIANCQSIVTSHYCEKGKEHFPILGELFLPQCWTKSKKRMQAAKVPSARHKFLKKWELALHLLMAFCTKIFPIKRLFLMPVMEKDESYWEN
ncbi:Isrso17-transposase protein [Neochlamydia sp. EPS4]|uniref:transposase n=1 Tax=Neochlamydia sp. EPS4 TaxID=1478175 RepID=UPI000582EF44|nr:Isrso17-transposase protein [Neochlamydia sp. EPS4]